MVGNPNFIKGNQEAKGNKGGGRKGFEFEQAQMKKMSEILNRALVMAEHIQLNESSIKEAMAYENTWKMVSKIIDKIHANRQHIEMEGGELPFQLIQIGKIQKDGEPNQKS